MIMLSVFVSGTAVYVLKLLITWTRIIVVVEVLW